MKIIVFLFGIICSEQARETWGENGHFLCGNCAKKDGQVQKCNKDDGKCPNNLCQYGWKGEGCDEPTCDQVDCMGGACIGPNQCVCTGLTSKQTVKVGDSDAVTCYSLRLSGLKGAVAALLVLIFSITGCALGHHFNTKGHTS